MIYRMIVTALIAIVFLTPSMAITSDFKDILDVPALKSPLAIKSLLNGIAAAGKRLVSVGQHGHILYSDDGGRSWTQANVPVSSDLTAVSFPSLKKGWAVGHDGVVLFSEDGGVNWMKQFDGRDASRVMQGYYTAHPLGANVMEDANRLIQEGLEKSFLDVCFEDERNGFIVGAFNLIFHTTDGGKNWEPWFDRTENEGSLHLYAIKRIGNDVFITGEQGLVMKLDQEAKKFRRMKTPYQGTFFGITGRDGMLVVFGMRGNVFCSSDRGASWQKVETEVTVGLTGATVADDGRIILVSQAGEVLVSKNGGLSFSMVKVDKPFLAAAIAAIDRDAVVLVGFGGVELEFIK